MGHRYSPLGLLIAHSETQERALYAAALALQEAGVIGREVAAHVPRLAEKLAAEADEKRHQADAIKAAVKRLEPFSVQ